MPEHSILKVNEIFWSFQGEGARLGFPSIFLRLAGCKLGCPYCDTKDSWETGNHMQTNEIITKIDNFKNKYPASQIVITGGEPLEQNLSELVMALKNRKYFLAIETNGMLFQDLILDWWAVSPKDVSNYFINGDLFNKINVLKLLFYLINFMKLDATPDIFNPFLLTQLI